MFGYAGQFYRKSVSFASFFRQCHAKRSGKILTGQTFAHTHNFFRSPDGSNISSVNTRTRSQVDKIIRRAERLLVMLYDNNGIPLVAEIRERIDEFLIVALVQSD